MSARDEILKAADDPGPIATLATPPAGQPAVRRRPPTQPPPIPPQAQRSGELAGRQRQQSDSMPAIPSMIFGEPGSSKVGVSRTPPPPIPNATTPLRDESSAPFALPPLPTGVIDLSANVPADTWMANPDTDLLKGHRLKGILNIGIVLVVIALIAVGVTLLVNRNTGYENEVVTAPPSADARKVSATPDAKPIAIDAAGTMSQDDIIALSRYGFFSITATAKTMIYIDDKLVGETPLTRMPIKPGPHKVKAVGPRGKSKQFSINIYATKDTDQGTIAWDKER